jgi:hypothetical protein
MQETEVKLSKGDWVSHPRMPDWGYGKVLELIGENKGRVLFLLAGEKKMSWEHSGLVPIEDDEASQVTLNEQLLEFKQNLARDLFTFEELGKGVTCTPCGSLGSACELCKSTADSLRIYSLTQRGTVRLCDPCRDKIMLEARDRAGINQGITEIEKKSKKDKTPREKKERKLKIVK